MGEDSAHADRSAAAAAAATLPETTNSDPPPGPTVEAQDAQEGQDFLVPGFNPSSAPSSPTQTLSRLGTKTPTSPLGSGGQVSAITVVALLDKVVAMIEAVQENQRRMEKRQAELEGFVRGVQGDVARLTKTHSTTSTSVAKLLERSRKTGGYVKEVRERLERQSNQVKRLEANHAHLLKRNHFKVLIFQVSYIAVPVGNLSSNEGQEDRNRGTFISALADRLPGRNAVAAQKCDLASRGSLSARR
ncbi:hypothetical protein NFI96_020734 [Prochilodus magdalenae]|nr:hypothetical protein NFI96_020734 [Prochilodus magdalenae]